ncbi:MAG TPA: amidohydrolase [Candidatus Avilachnospira avistercoris]|nr:amidohydrolase [Candidatus Avilachnospira avistercoris]
MWEMCRKLQPELVRMRRELHQIPEVGDVLPKTRAYVEEKLREYGIAYTENASDSGLVAVIEGGRPGACVAFRADMDALPIEEENEVEYKSCHEGAMHACGHDSHMAMLLGAAKVLNEHRAGLSGSVRLFFQTNEEGSRGAERMVKEGCMEGVDAVFGTHIGCIVSKDIPSGTVIVSPGCCMASFDKFIIRIKGLGCHGSTPEKGVDPINIAAHIIINLQEVVAREIAAVKPAVLTIGMINAGFAYNAIPTEVTMEGTIRALEEDVRQQLAKRIAEISRATAETFRGSAETEMVWGAPPVVNDAGMAALAADCARDVAGADKVIDRIDAPNMGGEDFAYYLSEKPGAFMFLSSSDHAKMSDIPHHNPRFNIDEDVLWEGSAVFVRIAERFLNGYKGAGEHKG